MKVSVENGIPGWSRAALEVLQEVAGTYNATITSSALIEEIQSRSGRWANVTSKAWVRKVLAVVTLKCQREEWPHLAALVLRPSDSTVGPWYGDVLAITGPGTSPDEQHHAAEMRLECYRHFGADVPTGAVPVLRPVSRKRMDDAARPARSAGGRAVAGSVSAADDAEGGHGGTAGPGPSSRAGAEAATPSGRPARGGDSGAKGSGRRPQSKAAGEERTGGICPTCFMQMPLTGECPNCG
ncbi:hypothetical protein [Pseudactinotalea sp. HY160]|uniref:hypothetical protein n=1 Tax=Pseudactinotalea sp. HY160 TaxID=2654490 RepID=UPI00128E8033|nr:hypothetical protein [Pseudactinotalea sp. HY160]